MFINSNICAYICINTHARVYMYIQKYVCVHMYIFTCVCVSVHTHGCTHTLTPRCVHTFITCCARAAKGSVPLGLGGCVCEAPQQDTDPRAAHSAALVLSLHPEKLWGAVGPTPYQSPLKVLSVPTHPHWILTVPAASIDPPSMYLQSHLSPSFNKPCERHPGLGHVTVPCPQGAVSAPQTPQKQMGFGWWEAAAPSTPQPSIARSNEHLAQGTNKLFSNFCLLMAQSGPNEPSG